MSSNIRGAAAPAAVNKVKMNRAGKATGARRKYGMRFLR
jgi:hypothetical protein